MRPGAVNGDLFGKVATPPKDRTPVTLQLQVIEQSCTDKAWFLRRPVSGAKPGFAPRSECRPVKGREGWWTMPRWLAAERGWL